MRPPINTPLGRAVEWYRAQMPPNARFEGLIEWVLNHGTVYSDAHTFLIARPWQREVGLFEAAPKPDTWLILLATTNGVTPLRRFMDLAPFELPWVAYHRRQVLRVHAWQYLDRKLRRPTYGNHR